MYVYDTNEGHEKAWHRKTQGKRVFQTSAGSRKGQEKKTNHNNNNSRERRSKNRSRQLKGMMCVETVPRQ